MPDVPLHPVDLSPEELLAQCEITFVRRSGPGGQHRNKVSTGVVLMHKATGVTAEANERRSQAANREVALDRLRVRLALEIRSCRVDEAIPSALWRMRAGGGRILVSRKHQDFARLLAEALDVIAANDFDHKKAADRLGCSPSQLIKLFAKEPESLRWLNHHRAERMLHPLR